MTRKELTRLIGSVLFLSLTSPVTCSIQKTTITPGFDATQMNYIDNEGFFLISKSKNFAFGFTTLSPSNTTAFRLSVYHPSSTTVVWTANDLSPVTNNDNFLFTSSGDVRLNSGDKTIWSTNTTGADSMELTDSGNLVVLAGDTILWQSFGHPTDTLLQGQNFSDGMALIRTADGGSEYSLNVGGGDVTLRVRYRTPQTYWSARRDPIMINDAAGDNGIFAAKILNNSWNFYDQKGSLLKRFMLSSGDGMMWSAQLQSSGSIVLKDLRGVGDQKTVPAGLCAVPNACGAYKVCTENNGVQCNCPVGLGRDCSTGIERPCGGGGSGKSKEELLQIDGGVGYFATDFVSPTVKGVDVMSCQRKCDGNCSCLALFFDDSSRDCYLFDQIGSLQASSKSKFTAFVKVAKGVGGGGGGGSKHVVVPIVISLVAFCIVLALVYVGVRVYLNMYKSGEQSQSLVSSDEDNFLENISGMPVRFSYRELQDATNNFSVKLGQGGFGSVYDGKLVDGTRVAVKKLEGIGQGKKEFRAEVSTIGSIHHVHLVRIRGFCAEGAYKLLAYEFMANGSLEKWIFRKDGEFLLDWEKRFNIALGTAKGLAYLHEDCDSKIVHCDIKPENVLLDDNFLAKVSDFGLAKLMTREQSQVFTTMRGTRGYLAPEWIINAAISEKSDVYSFGMVLLEIIGGRKNFDPSMSSEKAHFPSYTFKKMEEGKLEEVLDANLRKSAELKDERVERAIKVALWCIQEDMSIRPSMTKVVQMLEGVSDVPQPPISCQMGFRLYANLFKTISEEGSSSCGAPSDCNSDAFLSAVRLSGPR